MEVPDLRCSSATGGEAKSTPYAEVLVRLSKQEHIELVWAENYWKMEHGCAAERALSAVSGPTDRAGQIRHLGVGERAVGQILVRPAESPLG